MDTTKYSNQLKLVAGFADGDDRTIILDDPKDGITKGDIVAENPYWNGRDLTVLATKILKGDKTGADFTEWKSAKVVEQTTVYLDLSTN